MQLTPNALSTKISQLVKEGYPQKQAIAIAYSEMRIAWRDKHPVGRFPVWLEIETRGKNPISEKTAHKLRKASPRTFMKMTDEEIKKAVKVKRNPKKYGARSISPDTTEISVLGKLHTIYDAYPSLAMATKYATDYKKSGMGNAVVRDLSAKAGRLRYALFVTENIVKNPVRLLKKKTSLYVIVLKYKNEKNWYFTGTSFDDVAKNAAVFHSYNVAWKQVSRLEKMFPHFKAKMFVATV